MQHWVPFWSGAEHHDFHHMAFMNNFSTSFRWCDFIFGTDTKYRAYRKRINAMKKSGLSAAEFAAMEKKMMDEAEAEGLKAEAEAESYRYGNKKTKTA